MSSSVQTVPSAHSVAKDRRRRRFANLPAHLILSIGAIAMVFPLFWQIQTSLGTNAEAISSPPSWFPAHPNLDNYSEVLNTLPFLSQLRTSIIITVIRVLFQLLFCSLAGYAFARIKFPAKNLVFGLFLSVLMVPGACFLIPQYQIIQNLGWINTWQGIAAPGLFSAFGTFLMRQFFAGLPRELEEAARVDGAGIPRTFFRIMLPLAKPGLIAMSILTILWSWNDLLWPIIVATNPSKMPLSGGLASLVGDHSTDYPLILAGAMMAMLPIIILFIVLQRQFINGVAFQGSKG